MQPVLLIVLPLLLAFISILVKKEYGIYLLTAVALFNAASSFFYEKGIYLIGGFSKEFGISLVFDDYSMIATQVINVAVVLLIILSFDHLKKMSTVVLIAIAGLNGMMLTNDLFNLFVFLEVSSIAAYILTTQSKDIKSTFNYLVLGVFGSSLYLLGIVLVYKMVGYLEFSSVANAATSANFFIPVLLVIVGFGVEAKLMPFSGWVKGVLSSANKFTSVLIASIYSGTMLFVLGRLLMVFTLSDELKLVLILIGLFTMIMGEAAAYASTKLKEVLAFSSVGQAGLTLLLFISNLYTLAIMHIIANVIVKMILFNFASRLDTDNVEDLKGLFNSNKLIGLVVTVGFLSLLGVPFLFGFIIKLNVLFNLMASSSYVIVVSILAVALIEAGYIIKILVALWNSGVEGETPENDFVSEVKFESNSTFKVVMITLSLVLVLLGLMPGFAYNYANGADDDIVNDYPVEYIEEIGGEY